MSKTWEHYHHAARHHERAAYHYKEAAKYDEAEAHEKAAQHAYLAYGHNQHAIHHDAEAAKLHAEQCNGAGAARSEQGTKKKSAASEGPFCAQALLAGNEIYFSHRRPRYWERPACSSALMERRAL